MKKIKTLYWIFTSLFAAMMIMSSIPDILVTQEAVTFMNSTLGYPIYIIAFIGVAKLLGAVAILVPGFPRIKEWAYAGFTFDLLGATYSQVALSGADPRVLFMLLPITFGILSYVFYHKKLKAFQKAD
jgi:hypothetical protein